MCVCVGVSVCVLTVPSRLLRAMSVYAERKARRGINRKQVSHLMYLLVPTELLWLD